jgi:NTP pyrophosphatase (non-canonical NTP hydrolase)
MNKTSKSPKIKSFADFDNYCKQIEYLFEIKEQDKLHLFAFGIAEEAGEVLGKMKRTLREGGISNQEILVELGDLLSYMSCMARQLDSSLQEVADLNVAKMEKRIQAGTLTGKGDHR